MITEKLAKIQQELKVPKNQYNSFGNFKYRSCEDILEAVKPILKKNKVLLTISDSIVEAQGRVYIKANARLLDLEDNSTIENEALAREADSKSGMDASQLSGTASSYARKYCLNGLLLIDDAKDADTDEFRQQTEEKATTRQINYLAKLYTGDNLKKLLDAHGIKELKEMKKEDASKIIDKINKGGK